MFSIGILFITLFLQDTNGEDGFQNCISWCWLAGEPTKDWVVKHQKDFDDLGVSNFSKLAAHILHGLTVESAMLFFNIKLPNQNGIPSVNPNLTADDSDALLKNLPSRPNGYSSSGLYGFVDFMDHITDPDWMFGSSNLERMAHAFHMQELWTAARKAAVGFVGVSEDICKGALDHANNGIEQSQTLAFKSLKNAHINNTTLPGAPDIVLTWDDNGESWKAYKAHLSIANLSDGSLKSAGLYAHCLMRKFRNTDCCESKTVGYYSYTKVSEENVPGTFPPKCLNKCVYTRDNHPGSQYCFAKGDDKVFDCNK